MGSERGDGPLRREETLEDRELDEGLRNKMNDELHGCYVFLRISTDQSSGV